MNRCRLHELGAARAATLLARAGRDRVAAHNAALFRATRCPHGHRQRHDMLPTPGTVGVAPSAPLSA